MADVVHGLSVLLALVPLVSVSAVAYDLSEDNFERLVFRPSNAAAFVKF